MPILRSEILPFSKFQGAGNDFIVIGDLSCGFPCEDEQLIRRLCHRQMGIGADGLILVQPSSCADYKMRIFNQDGKEAEMCGNGLRCMVLYLAMRIKNQHNFAIETMRGIHPCCAETSGIRTALSAPIIRGWETPLACGYIGHLIDTGVPHIVIFVSDLQEIEVGALGREIRYQKSFAPEGVNVNFACIYPSQEIGVRTYERGVEGETLACGTGVAAVAVAANRLYGMADPITLICKSQEKITCHIRKRADEITEFFLQGPAHHVFDGKVALYSL